MEKTRITGRILTPAEWLDMIAQEQFRVAESGRGNINVYVCDLCQKLTVSVDLDAGVTPFMMPCKNNRHLPEGSPAGKYGSILDKIRVRGKRRKNKPGTIVRMPDGYPISARSVAYKVPGFINALHATFEFYRPTYDVYSQMKAGSLRDHVTNGGLLFRSIDGKTDLKNLENEAEQNEKQNS